MVMNAMQAERAAPLAIQPDPNNERANTPKAAQLIWATNILYFCKFSQLLVSQLIIIDEAQELLIFYKTKGVVTSFSSLGSTQNGCYAENLM